MTGFRTGFAGLIALALLAAGSAAAPRSASRPADAETRGGPLPRSAYLAPSNLLDVQLSPSGSHVAYLRRQSSGQSLWLTGTAGEAPRRLLRHSEATRLHWSSDGRWLFLESRRQLFALPLDGEAGAGAMTLLGGESGRSVLASDPADPAAMLVREAVRPPGERHPSSYRVLRLAPMKPATRLLTSREEIADYLPGRDGGPGFVKLVVGDHFALRRIGPRARSTEMLRCSAVEPCDMLSSPRPGELVLRGEGGADLGGLLRIDSAGRLHRLHQDPKGVADLARVSIDPRTGDPLMASYRSTTASNHPLTQEMRPHHAAIRAGLGEGTSFALSIGRGPRARWLVAETGDRLQHARWHLYDPATRELTQILAEVEASARRVPQSVAAERRPIAYRASDGMLLHGFLTLPKGADPRRLPLVVHVHGGPWAHVEPGYSAMAQFLAGRGYAVFEPNFRGSTGHGRAYTRAGGSDFGHGRVQRDIVEGTRHLLGRGIGDPSRVGITGSSFGGYASLLGVTFAPELFRVAVAAMPPTDFGWVMRWQAGREAAAGPNGPGLAASLRAVGVDPADRAQMGQLSAQSPLANLDRLKRPVLLIAGGADESVPIRSVVDYAARLRLLGGDVALFVDPKSGHRVVDPDTQDQYLYLLSTMLHTHLGGAAEAPLARRVQAKLRRNLRLDSSSAAGRLSKRRPEAGA